MNQMKQYTISKIILVLSLLGFISIIFLSFYPFRTIVFNDPEFPILNPVVKQGHVVSYTTNYCKYINKEALVTRQFINDLIFITPATISNRPVGCHSVVISVLVPQEIPPGTYKMRMLYQYQVLPFRTITVTEDTEEFTVVE